MKYTREERKQWIAKWEQSGLSKAAFSRQHGLNLRCFYSWFDQVKPAKPLNSLAANGQQNTTQFAKVVIDSSDEVVCELSSSLTLQTANGLKLCLEKGASLSTVAKLIEVLNTCN